MGKTKIKMAKNGHAVTQRSRPVLNPRGPDLSKIAVHKFYDLPKIQNHVQVIEHHSKARGHTAVFDTGPHQSMIGQDGW